MELEIYKKILLKMQQNFSLFELQEKRKENFVWKFAYFSDLTLLDYKISLREIFYSIIQLQYTIGFHVQLFQRMDCKVVNIFTRSLLRILHKNCILM